MPVLRHDMPTDISILAALYRAILLRIRGTGSYTWHGLRMPDYFLLRSSEEKGDPGLGSRDERI